MRSGQQATQWIGAEGQVDDDLPETPVLQVGGRREQKPLTVALELEGKGVPMEVDTGTAVSLISEVTQKIPVIGVLCVQVKYGTYEGT